MNTASGSRRADGTSTSNAARVLASASVVDQPRFGPVSGTRLVTPPAAPVSWISIAPTTSLVPAATVAQGAAARAERRPFGLLAAATRTGREPGDAAAPRRSGGTPMRSGRADRTALPATKAPEPAPGRSPVRAHSVASSASNTRKRARPLAVRDFTVPGRISRAAAVSRSDRPSRNRYPSTNRSRSRDEATHRRAPPSPRRKGARPRAMGLHRLKPAPPRVALRGSRGGRPPAARSALRWPRSEATTDGREHLLGIGRGPHRPSRTHPEPRPELGARDERRSPKRDRLMPAHEFFIRLHVATLRLTNQLSSSSGQPSTRLFLHLSPCPVPAMEPSRAGRCLLHERVPSGGERAEGACACNGD